MKYVPQRDDDANGPLQMQIISLDYNSYVGKIGVGRINRVRMRGNMDVAFRFGPDGEVQAPHQPGDEIQRPGGAGVVDERPKPRHRAGQQHRRPAHRFDHTDPSTPGGLPVPCASTNPR